MRFYETIHGVYFDDLDGFGILHNARYVLLIERTIGDFWARFGWGGPLDMERNPDQSHLVKLNHIEYLRPVNGVCQVRTRIWIERLGKTSLTFGFRIFPVDEDIDHARGTRVLVKVHPETRKPDSWTDDFRTRLAPFRKDLDDEASS